MKIKRLAKISRDSLLICWESRDVKKIYRSLLRRGDILERVFWFIGRLYIKVQSMYRGGSDPMRDPSGVK